MQEQLENRKGENRCKKYFFVQFRNVIFSVNVAKRNNIADEFSDI
jgi:hypothetical protein